MSDLDDLREVVKILEEGYVEAKNRVERDMPGVNPLLVCSVDGRYILLEVLGEIVHARAILVQMGKT